MRCCQVDFFYEEGDNGNVHSGRARRRDAARHEQEEQLWAAICADTRRAPISDVRVIDCTFDGVAKPDVVEQVTGLVRRNVIVNGQKVNP